MFRTRKQQAKLDELKSKLQTQFPYAPQPKRPCSSQQISVQDDELEEADSRSLTKEEKKITCHELSTGGDNDAPLPPFVHVSI